QKSCFRLATAATPSSQSAAQMRKLVNEEYVKVLLISQTPNNLRCTKSKLILASMTGFFYFIPLLITHLLDIVH
ncbi:MAG: hypothetical protein LBV67_05905, partial [Streptococcaceae bacterium]|nr:hypothetical protein [Streptococcaceae bacterium]